MNFKLDKPITENNEDFLNRKLLAEKISDAILCLCHENESAVLGLQGAWGSGKTSIINLIENRLKENKKENHIEVLRFDSRLSTDRDDLFKEFFTCIVEGINRDRNLHVTAEEIIAYANLYSKKNC